MKKQKVGNRISERAGVYVAAVMEYLVAEVLELAGNAAKDKKKTRINPSHIQRAVRDDAELNTLCRDVTIPQGGVMGLINPKLLEDQRKAE